MISSDVEQGIGTYYLATELLAQRSCDEGTNLYQVLEEGSFALFRGSLLTTYPKMKNETVNVDNVVESLSNSAFIKEVAGANIDDANGLLHISTKNSAFSVLVFSPDKAEPTDQ